MSFAAVHEQGDERGKPRPIRVEELQHLFAQTGLPESPGTNIKIIDQKAPGGAKWERLSEDLNVRAAIGFFDKTNEPSVKQGIREVRATGDLQGKPAIILHGRNDALIPPNHTSRPYYALARIVHGNHDARYIEVPNANHFDAFNIPSLFGARDLPLHYYFNRAIYAAIDHQRKKGPLPESQVLATKRRDGTPLTADNYREYLPDLMVGDKSRAIEIRGETLVIPRETAEPTKCP
jgi:hydroxybutyrate-dimer hydrolase